MFWDVTPCGSWKNQRFGGTYRLLRQDEGDQQARNRTLAVTSNCSPLSFVDRWFISPWLWRRYFPPKLQFLHEPHGVTAQQSLWKPQILHVKYCLVDDNAVVARYLYQDRYPGWWYPIGKTIISILHHICEHGKFAPCAANWRRPRSATPEVQEDVLDDVHQHKTGSITANGHRSFDSLDSDDRITAVSLPSAVCAGLVKTRLRCANYVLPVVLKPAWYES
jgi:hypothetical protein